MATSLEELLAEEGFKAKKPSKIISRNSIGSHSVSMPLYRSKNESDTSDTRIKTHRTRSDMSRYSRKNNELPPLDRNRGSSRRARDNLVSREVLERRNSGYKVKESKKLSRQSSVDIPENEIVEVGEDENENVKDIYANEVHHSSNRGKQRYLTSNSNDHKKGVKKIENYDIKSVASSRSSNNAEDSERNRRPGNETFSSEPALDEVAVQAMISILTSYIARFLKGEEFRTSLRHSCFSLLNVAEMENERECDNKIMANLEQAIDMVDGFAEETRNVRELKKASLLLSVISGLNSNELKDGFTAGIPNSTLSACAHLYLSVIYKVQKKERVSAKHLLQVFCESPYLARTAFLPDLWENLFQPHLSHLKTWYNQEEESLTDSPSSLRKLKLLEKVYNQILDSGTYQFAVYYKDWLTQGVETPPVPSILIPCISVKTAELENSHGNSVESAVPSSSTFSPKLMVSKRLYDSVFSCGSKRDTDEVEDEELETSNDVFRSFDGFVTGETQDMNFPSERVKHMDQDIEADQTKDAPESIPQPEISSTKAGEDQTLQGVRGAVEREVSDELNNFYFCRSTATINETQNTEENELTLKRMAKSIFEMQPLPLAHMSHSHETSGSHSLANEMEFGHPNEDSYEISYFSSTPEEFICPLNRHLFEDPVTLETGQTFEREAIKEWFDQGNRTCPVTGKILECQTVPLTNLVLKRVIDRWKSEHCRLLLSFASGMVGNSEEQCSRPKDEKSLIVLEKLMTSFTKEESIANAKHFISIGGLQFLVQRFGVGNLEEKARVAALLCCCIEADGTSRHFIAQSIDKLSILELLHSKHVKSRVNVVLLLIELICLYRRKDVTLFLSGLKTEGIVNTMHVLLVYLQTSPPEQRPLVAVLLLHLDILLENLKYSIYREEAVDAISVALEESLTDTSVKDTCCRALLILGGFFSYSGEVSTDRWMLKQAGFHKGCEVNALEIYEDGLRADDLSHQGEEKRAKEEWLKNLSAALIGEGKKSFLESTSRCLGSKDLDFVGVCLTTVAWLSTGLASLPDADLQLSAFSSLISRLKGSLEHGNRVEHQVLACMSLLNFSKIPECRVLLMTIAKDIVVPLRQLSAVTWTAKRLYEIISVI